MATTASQQPLFALLRQFRAAAGLARQRDVAIMGLDDLPRRRQAEAGERRCDVQFSAGRTPGEGLGELEGALLGGQYDQWFPDAGDQWCHDVPMRCW